MFEYNNNRASKASITARLRMHAESLNIEHLIRKRYPLEPEDVYRYRCENLPHVTEIYFKKVANVLARIRQARDFAITGWDRYGKAPDFENYCLKNYPIGGSVIDFFFNNVIRSMLVEPNGVIFVGEKEWFNYGSILSGKEYQAGYPICKIFRYDSLREYIPGERAQITATYNDGTLVTFLVKRDDNAKFSVSIVSTNSRTNELLSSYSLQQNLVYFPVYVLGGDKLDFEAEEIYDSYVSAALPSLDSIVHTLSEYDLAKKQHVFPQRIQWGGEICEACNGERTIRKEDKRISCRSCNGTGYKIASNSASVILLPLPKANEPFTLSPRDAVFYAEPNLGVMEHLQKDIDRCWHDAYSSINFEFLAKVPSDNSGVAKSYDKQELNSFLYKVSTRVINSLLNNCLASMVDIKYGYETSDEIQYILPTITVPENFDIITQGIYETELMSLRNAKVDPSVFVAAEIEYIEYRYQNQPLEKQIYKDMILFDPMPGLSTEEKIFARDTGNASRENTYLSINISRIVKTLYTEIDTFAELTAKERQAAVLKMAKQELPPIADLNEVNNTDLA